MKMNMIIGVLIVSLGPVAQAHSKGGAESDARSTMDLVQIARERFFADAKAAKVEDFEHNPLGLYEAADIEHRLPNVDVTKVTKVLASSTDSCASSARDLLRRSGSAQASLNGTMETTKSGRAKYIWATLVIENEQGQIVLSAESGTILQVKDKSQSEEIACQFKSDPDSSPQRSDRSELKGSAASLR